MLGIKISPLPNVHSDKPCKLVTIFLFRKSNPTQKLQTFKNHIQTSSFQGTTSTDSDEEQIAQVVSGFTTNADRAANVYDIQIACWGTIRQFVECVNEIYGTNYKIW